MLDFLPWSRGPWFHFFASKAFLESSDKQRSPKLYLRLFADSSIEMCMLKMCSQVRPRPGAHSFSFLQLWHFWKAPLASSHRNFILGYLLTPALRFGGSKCAPLSAQI